MLVDTDDSSLRQVIEKLDYTDADKLKEGIKELLGKRLQNELLVSDGVTQGLKDEAATVEEAAQLLNRCKDSLTDLVKIVRLLDDKSTDNSVVTLEQKDAIAEQVRKMLTTPH